MQVIGKSYSRDFSGLSVVADALEVMRTGAAAREINPVVSLRGAGGNAEARSTRMCRQLAPLDFIRIFMINLSCPAFVRRHIRRTTGSALRSTVNKYDYVTNQTAGMTEDGRTRERIGLAPGILLDVIDLHLVEGTALRPAADQINVAVASRAGHSAIHRYGHILRAVPALTFREVRVDIGNRDFVSLSVDYIPSEQKDLSSDSSSSRGETPSHARHWAAIAPLP